MEILERVKIRTSAEPVPSEHVEDMVLSVCDRIALRVGVDTCPPALASVAVEASVKAVRRWYYEGLKIEGDGANRIEFFEDILEEYAEEISAYKARKQDEAEADANKHRGVVRFI